jgi:hypothetical protein
MPPLSKPRPSDFPVEGSTQVSSGDESRGHVTMRQYTREFGGSWGRVFFVAPSKARWGSVAKGVLGVRVQLKDSPVEVWVVAITRSLG